MRTPGPILFLRVPTLVTTILEVQAQGLRKLTQDTASARAYEIQRLVRKPHYQGKDCCRQTQR
jgi:hypothetical protein